MEYLDNKAKESLIGVRMMNINQLCEYIGLGKNNARIWGKNVGAEKHFGKSLRYDKCIVDKALDDNSNFVL